MQLIDLNDINNNRLKLLCYGEGGSGKTSFAASLGLDDRTAPVLHLDALGNPVSLKRFKGYRGTVVKLTRLADLNPIFDWLYKGQPDNHSLVDQSNGAIQPGYKSLVIDGITKVQMLSFELAMGENTSIGRLLPAPEIAHYRQILIQLTHDFEYIYNLPMHIVVTALEDKEKVLTKPGRILQKGDKMGSEEQEGYYQFAPAIDGKSIRLIKATAQTIFRMKPVGLAEPLELATAKALNGGKAPKYSIAQFEMTKAVYAKDQANLNLSYVGDIKASMLLDIIEHNNAST